MVGDTGDSIILGRQPSEVQLELTSMVRYPCFLLLTAGGRLISRERGVHDRNQAQRHTKAHYA